ncbi:hypothetical protein EON83_10835 [bacterium]|nr:MAG: hypothetical protein EON83_10835 [bacterium]
MPKAPNNGVEPTPSLNPVHEFVCGVFPDDSGSWTIAEMVRISESLYCSPHEDVKITRSKFYDAVDRLNERSTQFEQADKITVIPSRDGYRYPATSCRLILREVIRGQLPKSRQSPDQKPTKTQ